MRIMSPSTRSGNEEMSVKSESLKSLIGRPTLALMNARAFQESSPDVLHKQAKFMHSSQFDVCVEVFNAQMNSFDGMVH